jgi:hypothetical protein
MIQITLQSKDKQEKKSIDKADGGFMNLRQALVCAIRLDHPGAPDTDSSNHWFGFQ